MEAVLKHLFVAACATYGVACYALWFRSAARKEPVWEWGLAYYAGSVSLLLAVVFGVMVYWDYYAA